MSPDSLQYRVSRREFLHRGVTVTAGAVVAGCGRAPDDGRVTLTQWYHAYGEAGTQQAAMRYAREYMRQNPHVRIQVVWVPGDYGTKLATAMLTPQGPDIFEGQLSYPMVTAGQVAPLDDLLDPAARADFAPRDLESNSVNGRLYGIKMLDDMGLLYYRKSLLRAAGVEPPRTMDELIAVVGRLAKGERKGLFAGNDGGISALTSILPWSAGCDFLQNNRVVFDQPRTVLAYEKLRDLRATGALLIGAPTDWWDPSAFIQGLAAMQWTGLWAFPAIRKALGDDVGAIPWPALDANGVPATFLGGWTQMVNAQGRQIEEAKRFVRWLWVENRSLQTDWCLSYGFHVPPRASVAQQATALRQPVPAEAVEVLATHGRYLPPLWNSAMGTALGDAVTNIVLQGHDAAPEIAGAARRCERELARSLE